MLGEISDLIGERFNLDRDRKLVYLTGNANCLSFSFATWPADFGTAPQTDCLTDHYGNLLPPFAIVDGQPLELSNARAIFAGVRQFHHFVCELFDRP